jgi:putative FmdB family regulatory protein
MAILHDYRCRDCGHVFEAVQAWDQRVAPCPACQAPSDRVFLAAAAMHDDVLTGGPRWMHNLDDHPVWVETKTQLQRELGSRGLRLADRASHNTDDATPYATRTRLKPGKVDPFLGTGRGARLPARGIPA